MKLYNLPMVRRCRPFAIGLIAACSVLAQAPSPGKTPVRVNVTLAPAVTQQPVSGRLIIVMSTTDPKGKPLDPGPPTKDAAYIAAQEVERFTPGETITFDPDQIAFPAPLSSAPAGHYWGMVLLDRNHSAAYRFLSAGDLRSEVTEFNSFDPAAGKPIDFSLSIRVPEHPQVSLPKNAEMLDFVSPVLSAFWGRPIHMRGVVLLPPSYGSSKDRYPVVYWTHGFGGNLDSIKASVLPRYGPQLASGALLPMIYVFLDQSCPGGTHEFADSVNNGPWGKALTQELIPHIDRKYRTLARARARFATGHSSGGWAALWLGVTYPEVFGGVWPTAPDPSDFRNFTGPNLRQRPPPNMYRQKDGSAWPLVRMGGQEVASLEQFARQERVLGDYGGQFASFEWVFSPRGDDGRPQKLFDRFTGEIDTTVADAWEKYDIAEILRRHADRLRPLLQDHIHLYVGTEDTFHLDAPARLLQETMKELGIRARFTFIPGRTHFDLYKGGLEQKIAQEMNAMAHPSSTAPTSRR